MEKTTRFKQDGVIIERHIVKEGPSPYFIGYHRGQSRGFFCAVEMMGWLRLPEGSETLESLREFLQSFENHPPG